MVIHCLYLFDVQKLYHIKDNVLDNVVIRLALHLSFNNGFIQILIFEMFLNLKISTYHLFNIIMLTRRMILLCI